MIYSSLTAATRLLQINKRLASRLVGKIIPVSSKNQLTKNDTNRIREEQNNKENKVTKKKHTLLRGPVTLPLNVDNYERLYVKVTTDDNDRFVHLIKFKDDRNCSNRFTFAFSYDAHLFLRSLDNFNDECNTNMLKIVEKCKAISNSKETSKSSRSLYKTSGFVSIHGLYLIGLVWNNIDNQLYCQIKYIYGINKLNKNYNRKIENLEFHWTNLKTLRKVVYHMVYGWQKTAILSDKPWPNQNQEDEEEGNKKEFNKLIKKFL
ncbi:hypothetical protein ACQ4LE_004321 [Meloidogyne hapla]|uniref:Mitochondrial ribosomal protein L5 n=1 Tax=Meloidogyne hapla TaxID=6305 RepID=A0A1I8C1R3_MELHA